MKFVVAVELPYKSDVSSVALAMSFSVTPFFSFLKFKPRRSQSACITALFVPVLLG